MCLSRYVRRMGFRWAEADTGREVRKLHPESCWEVMVARVRLGQSRW